MDHMLPEIPRQDFRKGAQWFTMKRQHALIVMADNLYYSKFRQFCRPGVEANKNCIADEHYLPTFFHMLDPGGISNWSVTYVDWSERRWHPKTHRARDISLKFLKNITSDDVSVHVTSVGKRGEELRWPCTWNGIRRPCYLFARKFHSDSVNKLVRLFPNYTSTVPGVEANKNCIADEHYLPTFFHMLDPGGISNWSVTYVDWSERRWHPKTYRARDISLKFLKNITSDDVSVHVTSVGKRGEELRWPCTWNGIRRPCYLFARKFHSDSVNKLVRLFPNYTSTVV
ncbi:hypothetical protein F2Q68_00000910 [Brassica cretica]|uniref:Uncharacterized protein n=1 Tax=Brassica cretica TaxID=69181 RepID=A0A8S9JDS4_BRACR|nr:hypothetical protein F2Q68_00000910 [Brassica cretica]